MEKILEMLIGSAAGQRLAHSLIRQALQYVGGALMAYLALGGSPFEAEWADLSTRVAAVAAPLLVAWWTKRRSKQTVKTIEVAIEAPRGSLTVAEAEKQAKAELKAEKKAA